MAATHHAQNLKEDSKLFITTALLQLLETHDFRNISITQVVQKAGTSRMAFYRNFVDLEQVLTEYYRPKFIDIFQKLDDTDISQDKVQLIATFFQTTTDDWLQAIRRDYENILFNIFAEQIENYSDAHMNWLPDSTNRIYYNKFMSAGVFAIWREWLVRGQQTSLADITTLIRALTK